MQRRPSRSASCDDSLRCALSCSPFVSQRSLHLIDQRAVVALHLINGLACFGGPNLGRGQFAQLSQSVAPGFAPRRRWSPIGQVCTLWPRVSVRERTYASRTRCSGRDITQRELTKPLNWNMSATIRERG